VRLILEILWYIQIFRQSASAARCKPSTYGENTLDVGLWCRCSYKVLGQWGKQWVDCLPSSPEGGSIFFHQRCPNFMQLLVNVSCIVAHMLELLVWHQYDNT